MFFYQQATYTPCSPCTIDVFNEVVTNRQYADIICQVRAAEKAGDREKANAIKRKLPMFMFMAGDIEEHIYEGNTKYNEGKTGMWRNQKHTRLNGLVMLDFDDMETPPSQFYHKVVAPLVEKLGVLFAHVTPKGKGLRLVCIADEKIGNLADNQKHIAEVLGLKNDDACLQQVISSPRKT